MKDHLASLLLFLYFLPSLLALIRCRSAPGLTGILLLNLLAGWTGAGWLYALFFALLSTGYRNDAEDLRRAWRWLTD